MRGRGSLGMKAAIIVVTLGLLLGGAAGCAQPKPSAGEQTPSPTSSPGVEAAGESATFVPVTTPVDMTVAPAEGTTPTSLPTPQGTSLPATPEPAVTSAPDIATATPAPGSTYTVQSGDTLLSVAARFGVSVEAIQAANAMDGSTLLTVGQRLVIPGGAPVEAASASPKVYVVQSGDTAFSIAQRFGTTVDALAWANQMINPWNIYPGQELAIPEGAVEGASVGGQQVHIVQPGETLYSIAFAYNTTVWDIAVANDLPNPQVIYVGERLLIP